VAYPILRSRAANLKVQVEADHSKLTDKFEAAGTELDKQSRGLTATLSGDSTDELLGGGSTRADLALRSGHLDLGATAAALDAPPAGPDTAGSFTKATATVQRQQNVTKDITLQLQMSLQLSGKNLDSSEKFAMGGPTTLPGYASGEATGDSGAHAKIGVRWQIRQDLALTAFTDYARIRLSHDPVPGLTKNHKRLSDIGISADWMYDKHIIASAIIAWAGKETPNPTDNDKPRFWFTVGYAW
jgi:hemolysin activation/secretion protein